MKQLLLPLLLTPALALFVGCSSDNETPADSGVHGDATTNPDATTHPDATNPDAMGNPDATETPDAGTTASFTATLSGAEENPAVTTAANGTVTFELDEDHTTLHYTVTHTVQMATAGHIHAAQGGVNGGVVVALDHLDGTPGTATLPAANYEDLINGRLYVNIHSMAHMGGEIRGQIMKAGEKLYTTQLSGGQEVPPVSTMETGTAALIVSADHTKAHVEVTTSIANPTAAHIHKAAAGTAGGVVHALMPAGQTISVDVDLGGTDLADLEAGLLYVNIHTMTNMGGELRGQLLLPGDELFVAQLSGGQETPPVVTAETASGMLILNYAEDSVKYNVTTSATPTAAHIHNAPAGTAGGVVFALGTPGMSMTGDQAVTSDNVTALKRGLWYFNIHTALHMGGELRGQIMAPGEQLFTAILSGAEEVPPVVTNAGGAVGVILNATQDSIRYDGTLTMITPTAAHFHNAGVGMAGPVVYPVMLDAAGNPSGDQVVTPANVGDLSGGLWYVNIHTMTNQGGEIRGQLLKP